MTDIRTAAVKRIAELVDIIALEKLIDWESVNYEATRDLSIASMLEHYNDLKTRTPDILDESIISMLAYLTMENTMLWIEIQRMKQEKV